MGDVKKIALITCTSNFERHKNIIRAVHQKLKEMGGYVLYVLTNYGLFVDERAYDKGEAAIYHLLDEMDFDGCIIESNIGEKSMLFDLAGKMREKKIPFVTVNLSVEDAPSVVMNGYNATCQMVTHLIVKHKCTKINMVATGGNDSVVAEALRGYKDTLQKYGIEVDERRILDKVVSLEEGKELLNDFEKAGVSDVEAVVCLHDVHSIGLCLELEERGYKVPDDMLICSLNRSTNSVAFRPDISGVDRMDKKFAYKACELLDEMLKGKEVPLVNHSHGEIYFGRSCGCTNTQDDMIAKEFQQLVLAKLEMGNQIRQMMQYNDALDEVDSLDEMMGNLREMYKGLNCPQYILCLNQGAIDYISSDKDYQMPENGKFFDNMMHAVIGYTERTGELENEIFPVSKLLPVEVQEGDILLFYPVHHIEQVYGYVVFVNEYLPVDLYNYRICHESIASSMENLHRQMVLRKSINMLDELHMQDALTGLHNRFAWNRFSNDYTDKEAYCVVYMDMDGLKKINDGFGHMEGNNAIKITAEVIRDAVRENDLVTRCGGDEFQVLSANVDVTYWDNLQQIINDEINRRIAEDNLPYTFSVSYGYCICDKEHPHTFEECCDRADFLMYENKKARKAQRVG